jgi:conjugal transfer/type IV secretion protein DotA/TraY
MTRLLIRLALAGYLLAVLAPGLALAQTTGAADASIGEIASAAKRPDDKSREALVAVFGQVVNDPLSGGGAGGGDTILATIFQRTNVALLSIAGCIVGWGVFRRVAATAGSGSVFDAQNNSLWMPLRTVWGLSSLIPTANGWSIAQLVMLWAASIMGVGTANLTVDAAASALRNGTPLVMSPVMPQTTALARGIFEADLCMHGINYGLAGVFLASGLVDDQEYVSNVDNAPLNDGFTLRDGHGTYSCGGAWIDASRMTSQPQSTNLLDASEFSVADVYAAHREALSAMQATLDPEAKRFVQAVMSVQSGEQIAMPDANVAIASAAARYENTVQAKAATKVGDLNKLSAQIVTDLSQRGWWMLGSWYQTFAMANTKLTGAVSAIGSFSAPAATAALGPTGAWQTALAAFHTQSANSTAADPIGTPPTVDEAAQSVGGASALFKTVFGTAGQRMAQELAAFDTTGRGQTNPLIRLKTIGDYILGAAQDALGVLSGLQASQEKDGTRGLFGASAALGGPMTGAGADYRGVLSTVKPYLFLLILALFMFGVTLSVYLPMVPFVVWFGAVINWLVVVAEGVVAAPLWAIAHLGVDGEGFGQRSMHGYLFLLNMCIRPFLMCIGFFLGGGILVVAGTFLAEGFSVAVANAQYSSTTGIVAVVALFWLFTQMSLRAVHDCFNLIILLPDQVINWMGGQASARLGLDSEKVSSGFDQGKEKAGAAFERGASGRERGRGEPSGLGRDGR